jgi:hypothetical protein
LTFSQIEAGAMVVAAKTGRYPASMGRRSGVVDDEEGLSAFSLKELDQEIARCKRRRDLAGGREVEKAFEKRIHMLERVRRRVAAAESQAQTAGFTPGSALTKSRNFVPRISKLRY